MSRVVSARKIRDRMPRDLWELRPDCGHYHYEKVSEFPQQPVHVICRVCVCLARTARLVATLSDADKRRLEGEVVLSGIVTEGEQRGLVLDGGIAIPQKQAVQEVAAPEILKSGSGWAHLDGQEAIDGPEYRGSLPSCMQPRPGAPAPRPVAGLSRPAPEGPGGEAGAPAPAKVHRRYRKRGHDPNQGRLFE